MFHSSFTSKWYQSKVPMGGKNSVFQGMIILNSNNYSNWKIKMEDVLIVRNLYEPIDRRETPTRIVESKWRILHRNVVKS